RGTHDRLGTSTNADPRLQRTRLRGRVDALAGEGCPERAAPGDRLFLDDLRKEIELLLEELLVVGEGETEQRKGLRERPATEDDFGATARRGIQSRKTLEHPDRVIRT